MVDRHDRTARDGPPAQPVKSLRERFFEHAMSDKGLPSIGKELAYAVADIRQKLVEEAAYGRAVTPDAGTIHGRAEPDGKADPLGRSAGNDLFVERCRQAYVERQPIGPAGPERNGHGPDR